MLHTIREGIVQEWLGQYCSEYESFLTKQDGYEHELLQVLQNGHYSSELGNTMPLAVANALGVSFVILSSLSSSPVYLSVPGALHQ